MEEHRINVGIGVDPLFEVAKMSLQYVMYQQHVF